MAEQLLVSKQLENNVFAYVNHLLLQSHFVNDCFLQYSIHICLTCSFNVQVRPSFYFIFSQLNIFFKITYIEEIFILTRVLHYNLMQSSKF